MPKARKIASRAGRVGWPRGFVALDFGGERRVFSKPMEIAYFLFSVLFVSLSGALMPGPVLAVVVGNAPGRRWAGVEAAAGHALLELPLVALIALGFASIFKSPLAHAAIGIAGGGALAAMGVSGLLKKPEGLVLKEGEAPRSVAAGLFASLNPYFFLWWATAGAAIVAKAISFSPVVLLLMYFAHVLVDFAWYGAVGFLVAGSSRFGGRWQLMLVRVCGAFMVAFGFYFLAGAWRVFRPA